MCYVCGSTYPTVELRTAHAAEAHPGYRTGWRGRDPLVTAPDGTETIVDRATQARWRRAAAREASTGPRVAVEPVKRGRRLSSIAAGSATGPAEPAEPLDDEPETTARPRVVQPSIRLSPELRASSARDAVAESLTVETLATIVVDLSRVVSSIDGAGEAGHLSRIQGTQIAALLHESTVDFVIARFRGDVGRFKMAIAAIIILASKGPVHAAAIRARLSERRSVRPVALPEPDETVIEVPAEMTGSLSLADVARRAAS